jgi:transposase
MLVAEEAVEIRVLRRQGKSIREIARVLDVSRNTVRRYLRVEGLPRYEREARGSKLDPYKHYIDERVKAAAPDWNCGSRLLADPVRGPRRLTADRLLSIINRLGGRVNVKVKLRRVEAIAHDVTL